MSSSSAQAHARALVRQARAAVESGGGGGATVNAPTSIRGVSLCTQIPGVSDAVICVLCKKRVKTGKMWFIHSRTPQHQHLLQRLELALVSRESQPAAAEPSGQENKEEKKEAEKSEEKPADGGLLGAAYSDAEESSDDEAETTDKKEEQRKDVDDDVVIPPLRKPSAAEPIGPIPSNEDLLDTDDIRNYVTAELAGLVVSGTEFGYDVEDGEEGKKRRRRPPPATKKKVLATSALPAGFFDDEDKAAEVFGKEAPSERKSKEMQNDMRKLELELDAGDRRRLVEGNARYEEDSEVITDEYVRSLHHDQEERERHLDDKRDKRRRVHERHELHLPPPAEESSVIDTESSSDTDMLSPAPPSQQVPEQAKAATSEEEEDEDFDEDDFAVNWRSKSM